MEQEVNYCDHLSDHNNFYFNPLIYGPTYSSKHSSEY